MATRKKPRGRSKKRPNYTRYVFAIIVCFCSGAFTYGLLEYFFATSQKPAITKKEEIFKDKKQTEKNQIKFLKTTEPRSGKNIHILDINSTSQTDKFKDNNLTDANITVLAVRYVKKPKVGEKPKLAIIIDDVSTSAQVREIQNTKLILTPSFFPPTKSEPNTPKLSRKFGFFMIHLPVEALNFHSPQPDTLTTASTLKEIDAVIKNIRKNFPKAIFINNHTGSKFTANEHSMDMLISVLIKYNFKFIDSVTTAKTKGKIATKKYGMRYVKRDIFIDNIEDSKEIRNMLKKAVKIAQKNGYAIAIGHPKKITLSTLKNSRDIFQDVELVYLRDIYDYYR